MKNLKALHREEKGIVAFLVTMIVLIIITITVLSMATIARREQRQSLDRLLGSEAYYAAESGVNDVLQRIQTDKANHITTNYKDCSHAKDVSVALDYLRHETPAINNTQVLGGLNTSTSIIGGLFTESSYSCALVDPNPTSLEYNQLSTDKSINASINTSGAVSGGFGPINTLVIGWQADNGRLGYPVTCSSFPTAVNWGSDTPLLKIDVTYLNGSSGDYSRSTLNNNTQTLYAYPCSGGNGSSHYTVPGGFNPSVRQNGAVYPVSCDSSTITHPRSAKDPLRCNLNLQFSSPPTNLLVRVKPYYGTARVSILSLNNIGQALKMKDAQTVIDVTGKATDVLKRTQVRISNTSPYLYAIESVDDICKRIISVNGGSTFTDQPTIASCQPN